MFEKSKGLLGVHNIKTRYDKIIIS